MPHCPKVGVEFDTCYEMLGDGTKGMFRIWDHGGYLGDGTMGVFRRWDHGGI